VSWYAYPSAARAAYYRQIPKVELHRHLEGSLRIETLLDIAMQHGIALPEPGLHALVQMQAADTLDFATFLSKFQTLRQFYRTPEIIARVTREAVADAAQDGVVYLELRFTPVALGRLQGYPLPEVMDWVAHSAQAAADEHGIQVRLIASVNRHEPLALAEEVAGLAAERSRLGIVGLDLAGNEAQFSAAPFAGLFREARQSGLRLTIHAGEWGPAGNVRQAVELFGAERIGHGVRVLEDSGAVDAARACGTVFEVCITSNYQSGVVPALSAHPLPRLLAAGLNATLNTDDPGISAITLSDEYRLALEDLGLPLPILRERILSAARAAFLPPAEAQALEQRVRACLDEVQGEI
jgi:adenosine deaminase